MKFRALVGADIGGAQRELAAIGHGVARVDHEIDDHLLELRDVGLDLPEVTLRHHFEHHLLADQALQQHGQIVHDFAEIEYLRAQRLLAREGKQMTHQRGGAVGTLANMFDILERGVGRPVVANQEVGRHHDGAKHVVEIVRDAAGERSDHLHLLRLGELVLQALLGGGVEGIDDGGLLIALLLLDRGDIEAGKAFAAALERGVDRGDLALALRGLADGDFEPKPVALGNDREDRPAVATLAFEHRIEQPRKQRVRAHDPALPVDGRDRHWGVVEEAHEAHFGGALWIGAVVARAVEHERARGAGRAVGAERHLVEEPYRNGLSGAGLEVDIENFGLHVAGRGGECGQERGALAGHDIAELEPAGADLREVVVEPFRQRRVEI